MGVHDTLLHDLRLIWEGKGSEISNTWQSNRSPNMNFAKKGGSGSRNIAWMANAIGVWKRDVNSLGWVKGASEKELTYVETPTHKFRFSCFEFNSYNYDGWSWIAEVSAMTFIRQWKQEHDCEQRSLWNMLENADAWVTRMAAHRACSWAAQSRHEIRAIRDNGKLYWQGPGGYPAGLRSHPMQFWQSNQCGVAAVGLEPSVDRINPDSDFPFIVSAIPDWGLGSTLSNACVALANGDLSKSTLDVVGPYLAGENGIRTSVRWSVRRWGQTIGSFIDTHIEGGNTGAVWGTLVSGPDNRLVAYPYSSNRIRSGHPELGRGNAFRISNPASYGCWNLTNEETEKPGKGPRIRSDITLPGHSAAFRWEMRVDAPSELWINEERYL